MRLAQLRPSTTDAQRLYLRDLPSAIARMSVLVAANRSSSDATYAVYWHKPHEAADDDTVIIPTVTLPANTAAVIPLDQVELGPGEQLSVAVGTASAITFTLGGTET